MSALLSLLRCAALGLATLVPLRTRTSWQWYRRARGGRWSQRLTIEGEVPTFRWRLVPRCPGLAHSVLLGGESVPLGVCFDERGAGLEYTDGAGSALPPSTSHECHCEEWPS